MAFPLASALLPSALLVGAFPQDPLADALDEWLRAHAAAGWSGSVVVARDGRPLLERGYGFADFDADRANDEHTLFDAGPIAETVTAAALGTLAEAHRLDLDDALAVHLPGVPPHSRAITLRQLLTHRSGISSRSTSASDDPGQALLELLGPGPGRTSDTEDPWEGGYALLADVVERVTDRPFEAYVDQVLFEPAGMSASGFAGTAGLDPSRAALGQASNGAARTALEPRDGAVRHASRGAIGLVTSAHELYLWDRVLASPLLLDEHHLRQLFPEGPTSHAPGWRIERAADGGTRFRQGGRERGFASELRRLPEASACIAVLSNRDDFDPRAIADGLESLLLDRPLARPAPKGVQLPQEDLVACAGTYVGPQGRLVVRAAPGALRVGIEGQELLAGLGASESLDWKADLGVLSQRAAEAVDGLAHGDTALLRDLMAKRIARTWPDALRRSVWPAQLARHGAYLGVRPIGAVGRDRRVEVLLAVEHERGSARARVAFGPAGLETLEFQGPRFLASARLEALRKDVFRLQLGEDPKKLEFERKDGRVLAVRIGGQKLLRDGE